MSIDSKISSANFTAAQITSLKCHKRENLLEIERVTQYSGQNS